MISSQRLLVEQANDIFSKITISRFFRLCKVMQEQIETFFLDLNNRFQVFCWR